MRKVSLVSIGSLATALACVGVWVPGLPTVPFLILALWAFSRSSEKLSTQLKALPFFREALIHAEQFEKHRAISREVKVVSQLCAWGSFVLCLYMLGVGSSLTWIVCVAAAACSVAMFAFPTSDREAWILQEGFIQVDK